MSDVAHTDALAAEYVLGTLDSDEREQARALLGTDAAFAVKVSQWERRLGELHLMVEPVEPDAGIWARIKSKMPEAQQRSNVRLPEAHIPEPAPAAIPTEAPSLDAIEATISETALALTSEAAAHLHGNRPKRLHPRRSPRRHRRRPSRPYRTRTR